MIPDGDIALQPFDILSAPHSHPLTQKCKCVSSIHQRWRARSQSELGSHHLLASLPPPAVVFPQDLLEKGLEADNFAMLGLGDIVIPGDQAEVGATVQRVEGASLEKEESCETQPYPPGEGRRKD